MLWGHVWSCGKGSDKDGRGKFEGEHQPPAWLNSSDAYWWLVNRPEEETLCITKFSCSVPAVLFVRSPKPLAGDLYFSHFLASDL